MSIRAITFDFWGTLFFDANVAERHAARLKVLCQLANVDEAEAEAALQAAYVEFSRVHIHEQRTLDHHDGARLTLQHLGCILSPTDTDALARAYAEAILDYPALPIDGALDAVRSAAARVPIGVICDSGISPGASLRVLLERHGFLSHFTTLTFSDEVGVSKPQRPMFDQAAKALGVAPHEMLHIGDLEPTDIVGIHGVGGTGALIAATNPKYYDGTTARFKMKTWAEFDDVLRSVLP